MNQRDAVARWGVGAVIALTFVLHLIGNAQYGFFRDELYFIACSQHLAWGYVDQPPLVAVAGWLAAPFGYAMEAVRLIPTLCACATVWLASRIARELGGGRFAQIFAAFCTAVVPAYLVLGSLLTTTSWEPFSWTLTLYLILRIVRGGDPRLWMLVALSTAFGLYGKYSIALLVGCVVLGLLLTRERRVLATPWFGLAAVMLIVLVMPNLLWQWRNAWPFLDVIHADAVQRHALQNGLQMEYVGLLANARAFLIEQLIYTNPFLVPVWLAGLWLLTRRGGRFGALAVAYVLLIAFCIYAQAKGYYNIGVYAVLIAAGSVAIEQLRGKLQWTRGVLVTGIALSTVAALPLVLPVLGIEQLIAYTQVLHMTGQGGTPVRLVQAEYADEYGWEEVAQHVARIYLALPPAQRARTAVFADTYPYAAGLTLYGPRYGLPPIISPHNAFYLWGIHGYDGKQMIAVGATDYHLLTQHFDSVKQVDVYTHPYRWVLEGPLPIYLVTKPHAPLAQLWPKFKHYGP